jgi:hypothetical protein
VRFVAQIARRQFGVLTGGLQDFAGSLPDFGWDSEAEGHRSRCEDLCIPEDNNTGSKGRARNSKACSRSYTDIPNPNTATQSQNPISIRNRSVNSPNIRRAIHSPGANHNRRAPVVATSMITDVGMSDAVAIVTSSATMTTMLGKSSVWQPKRANADDCEKNSQESRFHHFRTRARDLSSQGIAAVRHAERCHS